MSSTVRAASIASLILGPDIEPLRSMIITRFFLTGDAVSTYHDLKYNNTTVTSVKCWKSLWFNKVRSCPGGKTIQRTIQQGFWFINVVSSLACSRPTIRYLPVKETFYAT